MTRRLPSPPRAAGFTLLEVVIALAILAVSLVVLVESQATAVLMTTETQRIFTATMLAQEKMAELQMRVESEGFTDADYEEQGDFERYELEGLDLEIDTEALEGYKWAYTFRQVDFSMATDLSGMASDLEASGYPSTQNDQTDVAGNTPDLTDMGVQPDMIGEMLSAYIREVRVVVWWGDNEDGYDQVELVSHAINPTGAVSSAEDAVQ